jgi:predicted PhzF superfamily epimerase YddE/YHI9
VRVAVVDAFTDAPFGGNPAGVVVLDRVVDADWMQQIAEEMRHSETAFLRPLAARRYALRWFTPSAEVPLCGHATLASAHLLGAPDSELAFETRSGELRAHVAGDGTVTLDFPALPHGEAPEAPELAAVLRGTPVSYYRAGDDWLVELATPSEVANLQPDLVALSAVDTRAVIVTAAAEVAADHDFVSRFFAPRIGVPEDPVTGAAHCVLGPFWAPRLGRDELVGVQLSSRRGRVAVRVRGARVDLTGRAVTVLDGELRV